VEAQLVQAGADRAPEVRASGTSSFQQGQPAGDRGDVALITSD
jgi:hypothetical protein